MRRNAHPLRRIKKNNKENRTNEKTQQETKEEKSRRGGGGSGRGGGRRRSPGGQSVCAAMLASEVTINMHTACADTRDGISSYNSLPSMRPHTQ